MDKLYYILIAVIALVIIIISVHYFLQKNDDNIYNEYPIIIKKFDFNNYYLPKIIWSYWNDKNNIPICVQNILKNNTSVIKEWKINFLTDSTLSEYIPDKDLPSFKEVKVTQRSDWIRLYLLEKYGGCWLDASVIINDEKAFYKLRDDSIEKQSLFTGFYFGKYVTNNKFCHVESSFIMAPKDSSVIKTWRKEFEKAISMGFYKYKKIVKKNKNLKLKNIYRWPRDIYLTVYACFYNMSEYFDQSIRDHFILYDAGTTIFKLREDCKSNKKCIHNKLNNKEVKKHPYIKLVNSDRKGLTLNNYHL
jgi:hypothetical protein